MNGNTIQPNPNYNPAFAPSTGPVANQQAAANPQAGPPLSNAADLSAHPSAKNLQDYSAVAGEPDPFNVPEYQPIKPGEPYMEKLANEAMNTKKLNMYLKNAQENEELEDFKDAEEAYAKALKYTDKAEDYKLYGECLRAIYINLSQIPLTPAKDEAKERVYKEKAAKAFYYLGGLYEKQGASLEAHAAYRTSCELACHEVPLQALLDVAKKVGEKADIVDALEKLADFYAGKGDISTAIKKLEEAVQVEKSSTILEKLAVLHGQVGGEGSQSKMNETRIHQFELQISEDPKNIGVYRKYVWFLKDIGKRNEARAVKERIDELLQQKLVQQKARIKFLERQVVHLNFSHWPDMKDVDLIPLLEKNPFVQSLNLEGCEQLTDAVLRMVSERFENLKELNLTRCKGVTEAGLDAIAENASQLKRLTLDRCPATTIKLLHKLNAKGIAFSIQGLSFKKNVLDLWPHNGNLTDAKLLEALKANPEITELSLYNFSKITDAGIAPLKNFQWLTSLHLENCTKLTDAGLQHLKGLTQLTSLKLVWYQLTDASLQHLAGLTQLTTLDLSYCKQLTDAGLQHLASLTQLTSLNLNACRLTDWGFQYLSGLTQLTSLELYNCSELMDAGLKHLKGLTQLTTLNLACCTNITSGAKEQLRKQIPGLTIHG